MAKCRLGSWVMAAALTLGSWGRILAQTSATDGASAAASNSPDNKSSRVDLVALLAQAAPAVPARTWQRDQLPWEPAMIRALAAYHGDQARAEKVLKGWIEGRCVVWTFRKDPARIVGLSIARFKDEVGARSFLSLAVDWQRKRDTPAGSACTNVPRILESRLTELSLPGIDQAILSLKRLESDKNPGLERPRVLETTVLARVSTYMVECSWRGVSGDPIWLKAFLTTFTNALNAAPAAAPSGIVSEGSPSPRPR